MRKGVAGAIGLAALAGIWVASPALAVAANVAFRPGYVMREFANEYRARLRPNRVHWFDFRGYRLQCPEGERRAVVLHTTEFTESPDAFLARRFPECPERLREESSAIPPLFHGVLAGRW